MRIYTSFIIYLIEPSENSCIFIHTRKCDAALIIQVQYFCGIQFFHFLNYSMHEKYFFLKNWRNRFFSIRIEMLLKYFFELIFVSKVIL